MTSDIPDIDATNDEPTEPREPTRYPCSSLYCTSFCAIIYSTAKPCLIIDVSSFSSRDDTISGGGSPYSSFARVQQRRCSSSSEPSRFGVYVPFGIGRTSSIMSAIRLVFVITTSRAPSSPR